ncbi:MAG: acetoacetate--CoA ligase [Deltaproteobacteria bacterium]|nr:acetoacetate--CoA ligase [Deltaproteobacteria bacterium]
MGKLLWSPSRDRIESSNMWNFMRFVNEKCHQNFNDYVSLYQWSIKELQAFWSTVWEFVEIKASETYYEVIDDVNKMPGARWFSGSRLNFAENLLRYRDDKCALLFIGEDHVVRRMTYAELYDEVARTAISLKYLGIRSGDRVVGFMPNMPETIIAMLAATSIGAVWSSCSPDFGIKGVLDRFGQIKPRVLFTADGYWFKGKKLDSLERVSHILNKLPGIEKCVVIPYTDKDPMIEGLPDSIHYRDFKSRETNSEIEFEHVPFDHPLYIMYSSGTTGLPKCMVQSVGGVLINQLKELILHTDLKREDTIFYYTTCGWMMWNWLVASLGVGATLVLYDGNPFHPDPGVLWKIAQDEKVTIFGTSAGYISVLMNEGIRPGTAYDLSPLKAILSTGSPLSEESFEFIYQEVKEDLQLSSISGGSDINGCFALGNPMGPVYAGELQCRGLGMKVEAFDDKGTSIIDKKGELVCTAPAPPMPIYFWDDPDGKKYRDAYFNVYPNVWRHGDFIEINSHGGVVIYGRSDSTLKPGGVRIGTADIYRVVEQINGIEDSLVVGQDWKDDIRIILFVKMSKGFELNDDLRNRINKTLREEASPRHVPSKIIDVPDIPYTLNMKKVELAVRRIIHGQEVPNKDALRNPEALDDYADLKELREN